MSSIAEMIAINEEKSELVQIMHNKMMDLQARAANPARTLKKGWTDCADKSCPSNSSCNDCPYQPRRNYLLDEMVSSEHYINKDAANAIMQGFTFLGAGNFARVYRHDLTGLVVKVTGFSEGALDTYPAYAKFCMANKGKLKHLPDILHIQEYSDDDPGCTHPAYFVIMRECFVGVNVFDVERGAMANLIRGQASGLASIPEQRRESVIETCTAIAELAKYAHVDLHSYNVMQDADGEPVLTDPFSYSTK